MHTDGRSPDSSPNSADGSPSDGTEAGDSGGLAPGTALDVVAIGNALVDVLASAHDADLEALDLVKGTMVLVDQERSEAIYATMGPTTEASGGSAANTAAGMAALGGRVAFLGRVAGDQLGQAFTHDIRSVGVAFDPTPTPSVPGQSVTGHCLVLVTDDAERTMATHLGVASDFSSVDLHDGHLSSVQVVYLEGYLWEQPSAKAAMREAIEVAHAHDAAVALTVSDPFCVEHHRAEFLELLKGDLEMLFANEEEVMSLFGSATFEDAVEAVVETGVLAVLTRGAAGCVVVAATGPAVVPAAPVERVVDTTGAGDLFAAGFLYGITNGLGPEDSARLGSVCAAEVISHVGARPQADLRALAVAAGLFN
ncbi:MAG TPA: adenosine kinase [Acidimicrobiales bacterium]|nr:adenosine kinase [Acidimicrobiales bacterium]